ncbi:MULTISPECIES: pyrroloquinoline quinone biosynthesis peptide chaperone PqqD [Streptomyces]|uniref:pyrroloquinoline quinone biosynthesis peptide chaperone PqqD n=2 Tax=Streptomyces TaxID=1883 RepID=UPI0029B8DF6F|nr:MULTISPECIES: pyrroloquinoline quinone biosynthesis peptide chaperone PqqD [unclassified Streptomyces]MDX3771364.1 pyrroloquinoline quinone biosynthesis peptide chaperone PqqD [Streptomyces sp. AK08-01B]MDX3820917.1 pyrroloquinoline quinone biosynthesis peptide chaperone PqqD [Streptomyces sp. AK08-01A]WSQ25127.1 pyrroloquinoline quinone biosynthesis peptide chaperone PqqD [Streptomyces sp. NBC_01230]
MNARHSDLWCPRRAPAVVLRHDRTRGKDVLLMPERVVVLEGSARSVIELCDGTRTVARITDELRERFPAAPVDTEVSAFIERLHKEGWIR